MDEIQKRKLFITLSLAVGFLSIGSGLLFFFGMRSGDQNIEPGKNLVLRYHHEHLLDHKLQYLYTSDIVKKFPSGRFFSVDQITKGLHQIDFVKEVAVQKTWWSSLVFQVEVYIPVAMVFHAKMSSTLSFAVSPEGKILRYSAASLPVLSPPLQIKSVAGSMIQDERSLRWLQFLQSARSMKDFLLFHYISEVIFKENETEMVLRGFFSRIFLPKWPQEKIIFKLDAILRYFILKKQIPAIIDLRGENAVFPAGH